jgi:hypothetical protein
MTLALNRLLHRSLSPALILAASVALGACSSDENPMGPSPAPEPDPAPSLYEVVIDLSHLTVLGTCESASDNAGDFDYTIAIWRRDANDKYILHRELTGSFKGYPEQTHRIDKVERFRVLAGKNYYVGVKATDTDPYPNSDDYVGYAQDVNKAGGQLEYDHLLKIGNGTCGLTLEYTATEIPIL